MFEDTCDNTGTLLVHRLFAINLFFKIKKPGTRVKGALAQDNNLWQCNRDE